MNLRRGSYLVAGLGVALAATVAISNPAAANSTLVVRPGQSIQAALDAARPGDTVVVRPGTYRENLEMTTDGVTLVGQHAMLEPPDVATPRRCSEAVGIPNGFGICVAGTLVNGRPPAVVRPVENVTIRGMIVGKFPSTGIEAIGADGLRVEHSVATGGDQYGILVSQSTDTVVAHNLATGGEEAGIYVGDSPKGRTVVRDNDVTENGLFGVFIRNSSHGIITGNRISHNCVGIGFVPTRPDQDAVSDWLATGNRVNDNNKACGASDEGGTSAFDGTGVLLAGTDHVTVAGNRIERNLPEAGTTPLFAGGVVLMQGTDFGGPPAAVGNLVVRNRLRGNEPFDINVVDPGTDNRLAANRCATSSPAGLCR
ncbi:MAG TPA: right-handed parallel beta-helix repeat-containing protein [Streptosporangiaceae bacterium]